MCNNATAEINQLLLPEALEDSTSSVSPLASTAPVTESSFTLSPAFSTVPPRDLTPASLPEPSPLTPSVLSPNPMTLLVDFFSPSPLVHSLAPEPFPSLNSQGTIPHPNRLPFPLSYHMTLRQQILFSHGRPLCLRIPFSLLTPRFPKISIPYQICSRQ